MQSGVAVENENDFRVDLHCLNPGQTTVQLRMEIADRRYQQAHLQAVLQDDVTFEVTNMKAAFLLTNLNPDCVIKNSIFHST